MWHAVLTFTLFFQYAVSFLNSAVQRSIILLCAFKRLNRQLSQISFSAFWNTKWQEVCWCSVPDCVVAVHWLLKKPCCEKQGVTRRQRCTWVGITKLYQIQISSWSDTGEGHGVFDLLMTVLDWNVSVPFARFLILDVFVSFQIKLLMFLSYLVCPFY